MKNLHFTYDMEIGYSKEVSKCNFTIKCIPQDTNRQKIENISISLFPDTAYCSGMDGFRNAQIYGANHKPHRIFHFQIQGDAITGLADYEEDINTDLAMVFAHPHGLNFAGKYIKEFYNRLSPIHGDKIYDRACGMMEALHQKFVYKPGTTTVDTTAEEAFRQGCGVCQDYAHILIAMLHQQGIAARYVTGFIIGEGKSHAWVEILDGTRWIGIDPTHNKAVGDDYIKIGHGRDAKDCMINRGIMHGGGPQTQTVQVRVEENI